MNGSLLEAKHFFKGMPEEVVDAWLVERVESRGWPPTGPHWQALLRYYSPEQWQEFISEKQEVALHSLEYSEKSFGIISGLSAARFEGVQNSYTNVENSHLRMKRVCDYLLQTGRLPGYVILIKGDKWEIVDGSHRISCYFAFHNAPHLSPNLQRLQSAWVATPAKV